MGGTTPFLNRRDTLYIQTRLWRSLLKSLCSLATNPYLWKGITVIGGFGILLYVLLNYWLMPAYTLYGVSITVPDVLDKSYSEASALIEERGLRVEQLLLRKPNLPRNVVIDQNPPPQAQVKPGRRVYLTVNAGDTTTVRVPSVLSISLREAQNRINFLGLAHAVALPDSFPSPHVNTVTRQDPLPGMRVPPGTEVQLWISTGLGERQVLVPDVSGMSVEKAEQVLHEMRLNYVVIRTSDEAREERVIRGQSPPAGTGVKEGIVVRLRLSEQ